MKLLCGHSFCCASTVGLATGYRPDALTRSQLAEGDQIMQWTKPDFEEIRFGFEITMYILNR